MAKWGEGDPRWIVEERPDATNVNNWHWTEKNASQWSQSKLKELFTNLEVEDERGPCTIVEMSKCEVDASVINRKAKLIFFYDLLLTLEWKGRVKGSDTEISGKIEIPSLTEDQEPKDIDITVTIKETSDEAEILKEVMRSTGVIIVREKLGEYVVTLREEFSKGMILPTKDLPQSCDKPTADKNDFLKWDSVKRINSSNEEKPIKHEPGVLTMKEIFHNCSPDTLYKIFTDQILVSATFRCPCKVDLKEGGYFELLNGNITGYFVEVIPEKKITQRWRYKDWPKDHYSLVEIEIIPEKYTIAVHLKQSDVPLHDLQRIKECWQQCYWDAIKSIFGLMDVKDLR